MPNCKFIYASKTQCMEPAEEVADRSKPSVRYEKDGKYFGHYFPGKPKDGFCSYHSRVNAGLMKNKTNIDHTYMGLRWDKADRDVFMKMEASILAQKREAAVAPLRTKFGTKNVLL